MKLQKISIPYSQTGFFDGLIGEYLGTDQRLSAFYGQFPKIENFKNVIDDRSVDTCNRELLVKVLLEQYNKSNLPDDAIFREFTLKGINQIESKKTFTVTTGHQLCLFTGPLYFIYKIVTTINLAGQLKGYYPDFDFVPVFWMASEDHDFEEINHVNLFGKKLEWHSGQSGAVGKMQLTGIQEVLEQLKILIGNSRETDELNGIFERAYDNKYTLAEATRILVHKLFGKYGLVVIDGDNRELKREFIKEFKEDIFENSNFDKVNATIKSLVQNNLISGNKIQVNPREINCFYLLEGRRERIIKDNKIFRINNTDLIFTKENLLKELENFPERFSPNVVLRPLYQEKILPNIAYTGGPAEIVYWLELKTMFGFNNTQFPVLVPRNSVLWIDSQAASKMKKLNIGESDLFKDLSMLQRSFIEKQSEINFEEEEKEIGQLFNKIAEKAMKVDITLKNSVEAEKVKQLNGIKIIEQKIRKAEKSKHDVVLNQVVKLKEKLFPGEGLQERKESFIPFYLKYGSGFIDALIDNLKPLEFTFTILKHSENE